MDGHDRDVPAARGLAILIRATARHPSSILIEFFVAFMLIPLAMLPLIALLYASGMIQDEQEEQTITYLLVRPIPKWALYCTKLVANFTTAVVLTVVLVVLTYSAIYVGAGVPVAEVATRCAKAASVDSLAVVAYCSLFGLISLLTKRTLVVGIIYTAVVEGVFAVLAVRYSAGHGHLLHPADCLPNVGIPSLEFQECDRQPRRRRLAVRRPERSAAASASVHRHLPNGAPRRQPGLHDPRRVALLATRVLRQDARSAIAVCWSRRARQRLAMAANAAAPGHRSAIDAGSGTASECEAPAAAPGALVAPKFPAQIS